MADRFLGGPLDVGVIPGIMLSYAAKGFRKCD